MKHKITHLKFKYKSLNLVNDGFIVTAFIELAGLRFNGRQGYLRIDFKVPYKKKKKIVAFNCNNTISITSKMTVNHLIKRNRFISGEDYYFMKPIKEMLTDKFFDLVEPCLLTSEELDSWREYINEI